MINYISIGHRIRMIRRDLGMTQEVLAEKINVTPTHISRIETGTSSPSLQTLVDICNVLGVTIDDLMQDSLSVTGKRVDGRLDKLLADCTLAEKNMIVKVINVLLQEIRSMQKG